MPFAFSFCFRKGDVGGDRGFDAALAFRTCAEAESELEGDSRKKKMNILAALMVLAFFVR